MSRIHSEALVLRVNELFYDLIGDRYDAVHTEMVEAEGRRWREQIAQHIDPRRPMTIVDIGSGAGLVGMTILDLLKGDDTFVCADLSSGMLQRARASLESIAAGRSLDFLKIERRAPIVLPFKESSIDIATMNSVLHHVEETSQFLSEVDRILKPGGLFVIGHEPNRRFVERRSLRFTYALLKTVLMPQHTLIKASHRIGIYPLLARLYNTMRPSGGKEARQRLDAINSTLQREGLINRDLTHEEIAGITDIRDSEGFDPGSLFPHFELLSLETYNHLLLISIKHGHRPVLRRLEELLRQRYPDCGATFFATFRKRMSEPIP